MRKKEVGVTLSGFIMVAVVVVVMLLFAFKVGPAYFEYYSIEKQFKIIAADQGKSGNRRDVEAAFAARQTIENIKSIGPTDVQIAKEASGVVLTAEYSVRVPIVGNMSACMDFYPRSDR